MPEKEYREALERLDEFPRDPLDMPVAGTKVYIKYPCFKELTPAVVLSSVYSNDANYMHCWLKIAQRDDVSQQWHVSWHPKRVQSYYLMTREEAIAELDNQK